MAPKINIKIDNLPLYVKVILAVLPSVIIVALVIFLAVNPKYKQIKALEAQIDKQNNEIAASEAKAAKLDMLKIENEKLMARMKELKEQLPEEKEISSLLKQVSDLGSLAGLDIKSWKPSPKVTHSSGIVYEIPVAVDLIGSYHNLGYFLSSITKINRIININDIKLASPKKTKNEVLLQASFKASTFSSIPESELQQGAADKGAAKPDAAKPEAKK